METRYLLISKEKGFFLGTYLSYALFASDSEMDIVKVYTFESKEIADDFVEKHMSLDKEEYFLETIETKEKYVHIVDLIKAGYAEFTHNLVNNIQMVSHEVH